MTGGGGLSFRRGDLAAIVAVLLCALALGLALWARAAGSRPCGGAGVSGGEAGGGAAPGREASLTLTGAYTNTITVRDGRVAVTYADCPGTDCVHSGWVSAAGRAVVCLPQPGGDPPHRRARCGRRGGIRGRADENESAGPVRGAGGSGAGAVLSGTIPPAPRWRCLCPASSWDWPISSPSWPSISWGPARLSPFWGCAASWGHCSAGGCPRWPFPSPADCWPWGP